MRALRILPPGFSISLLIGILVGMLGLFAPVKIAVEKNPAVCRLPIVYRSQAVPPVEPHPKHVVKVWMARHRGRVFRVIQLPRCEHIEALIAYNPKGETLRQAKERLNGVAALTASFHHPKSMCLADFLRTNGKQFGRATTGRWLLVILPNGEMHISDNYLLAKTGKGVDAVALGQRLVPLHHDKFTNAFMNRVTDRMALGMGKRYIYIVQGKSDIWRLAHFIRITLPIKIAINTDGGHVVHGRGPAHIVFRWRKK